MSQKDQLILQKLKQFDNQFTETLICGIDEAGRGPLAGPVVVGACIMPKNSYIEGVNDSKKLSEKKREMLYDRITKEAISYSVGIVDEKTIDEINILQATKLATVYAIGRLETKPELILADALKDLDTPIKVNSIVKGDSTSYSIACASIIAKVTRDRMICGLDKKYPNYGFAKHKGYGTKAHIDAIKQFGPCEIHRRTFIKKFM